MWFVADLEGHRVPQRTGRFAAVFCGGVSSQAGAVEARKLNRCQALVQFAGRRVVYPNP